MEGNTKVIIDADPGIDDMECIAMFLKHTNVIALTTTYGNCLLTNATHNACRILTFLEKTNIPVYKGAAMSLRASEISPISEASVKIHGEDGLGNSPDIPRDIEKREEDENGPSALIRLVNENPGEITLVALGPLTNLAIAAKLDTSLPEKLKSVYIMGGSYKTGNVTDYAEFNFYSDPLAADIVLKVYGRHHPINLITWDCCMDSCLPLKVYSDLLKVGDTKSAELFRRAVPIAKSPWPIPGKMVFADQWTALVFIYPDAVLESVKGKGVVLLSGEREGGMEIEWEKEKKEEKETNLKVNVKGKEVVLLSVEREGWVEIEWEKEKKKEKETYLKANVNVYTKLNTDRLVDLFKSTML